MKIKVALFLLFFSAIPIVGQNQSIHGQITDSKNSQPVQNAVVFINYNYLAYSNNEGIYSISNIPPGAYTIKISRVGYKPVSYQIIITNISLERNFELDPSPIELDQVIVSTNRTDKFLRNSPYSEVLVNQKEIQEKSHLTIPDILKETSGISLLRDGIWGTEISIRGLKRENIVTLVDGNRIVTATDIAARLSMFDLNDIERIEVIKGASSSIYGSGATGGIINVITKQPKLYDAFSLNGNLSSAFNSVNNMTSTAASVFSGGKSWSSKLGGSFRKASNTKTPSGELKNSQFKDYSFSGSLNVLPFENHSLKLNYQLFKAEDVGIPGASIFPENADVRYPDEKRELISAGYEVQNISKLLYKLLVKYSYQFIARNVENLPHTIQNVPASGTSPARRVSVLKITPGADHKNNNVQVQANLLPAENNNLIIGIDYWDRSYNGNRERHQLIEGLNAQGNVTSTTYRITGEKPLPDSKLKSLGFYAQNENEIISKKLNLLLGARFDRINISGEQTLNPLYEIVNGVRNNAPTGQKVIWNKIDTDEDSYSGNLGIKYSLQENLDLTLSLGYSFRSPSLEERFQYIDQGSFIRVGDPTLKPEMGKSADLGIRFYSTGFKIITSIFYNKFDDLVAELPGTIDGRKAFIKTNIGEARLYGFDLRADYNFYGDNICYITASYVKGDDITASGNLPEIPPINGVAGIKFNAFGNFRADLFATIFSKQNNVAAGESVTAGYSLINFFLNTPSIKLASIEFYFTLGVENIFNKEYQNHLSTSRGLLKSEPGRNIFAKLNLNW